MLVSTFPARTSTDSKGCKPTGVAVARSGDQDERGPLLIAVVDDINKKLKVLSQIDSNSIGFTPFHVLRCSVYRNFTVIWLWTCTFTDIEVLYFYSLFYLFFS